MTRGYRHGGLGNAMVERALSEVRSCGTDKVSLRGITHALGVSPSAAYNHFAHKDDLLRAVGACGLVALDERMSRALVAHPVDSRDAAQARFAGLCRAYLAFAIDEIHLFQLTFGPLCAVKEIPPGDSGPYRKLNAAIDELDQWRLLKQGIRPGLDLMVWASTHGMATLLVEGAAPSEAVDLFIDSITRLILQEDSL